MENYLTGRQQRVVLNGQTSSWKNTLAGVLEGPLLLLIYINDLPNGIDLQMMHCFLKKFFFLILNSITI